MFPSLALMTAIQADRQRELERSSREHRMLADTGPEPAPTTPVARTAIVVARPSGRPGRSSGPAREAI
jgi:hypothetical protein